jgi:hypothetical protein
VLDRTTAVKEGQCSLLVPGKDVLVALRGELRLQSATAGTATFDTSEKDLPEVVGLDLAYLATEWEPYHVWMVAEPRWKWNRTLFHATDATARIVEGECVSVVDGEEVRHWVEIKENGKNSGLSRYYPVFPSGRTTLPPIGSDGIVTGGWNHAHCELCKAHVEAENYGYLDLGGHWVCEGCYTKYVANHDLSFIQT